MFLRLAFPEVVALGFNIAPHGGVVGVWTTSIPQCHPSRSFGEGNVEKYRNVPMGGKFVAVQEDSVHDKHCFRGSHLRLRGKNRIGRDVMAGGAVAPRPAGAKRGKDIGVELAIVVGVSTRSLQANHGPTGNGPRACCESRRAIYAPPVVLGRAEGGQERRRNGSCRRRRVRLSRPSDSADRRRQESVLRRRPMHPPG
ncbi:hypothetical protein MAUB1S_00908 [Mycolicibacterium aubagnense]